ncbi:MAG: hypothetical protein MHM6MM_009682 [Cercozoa sp. M6MM]
MRHCAFGRDESTARKLAAQRREFERQDATEYFASLESSENAGAPKPNDDSKKVLSAEQRKLVSMVKRGLNILFTGRAGTGKSLTLRSILKEALSSKSIAVTGMTGIAGLNIGGSTVHSWAGVGYAVEPMEELYTKVRRKRYAIKNWRECQVLVIDEVSMMSSEFFEKLEYLARRIRGNEAPFGGIQLVLCGDFHQLPPVSKKFDERGNNDESETCMLYESTKFNECVDFVYTLTKVFRQQEPLLLSLLNKARTDRIDDEFTEALTRLQRELPRWDGAIATKLYSHNRNVTSENQRQLRLLPGQEERFLGQTEGDPRFHFLVKNCIAEEELQLKVGAQVLLLKNLGDAASYAAKVRGEDPPSSTSPFKLLVNGSRGVVVGFEENPDTRNENNTIEMSKAIHRQGLVPIVNFECAPEVEVPIVPQSWSIERWDPKKRRVDVLVARHQIPLKLAYALTVHKAQGMSLSKLQVSLGDVFERGQSYVALSRATALRGLRVLSFRPDGFFCDGTLSTFHERARRDAATLEDINVLVLPEAPWWLNEFPPMEKLLEHAHVLRGFRQSSVEFLREFSRKKRRILAAFENSKSKPKKTTAAEKPRFQKRSNTTTRISDKFLRQVDPLKGGQKELTSFFGKSTCDPGQQDWNCQFCTFLNHGFDSERRCSMCLQVQDSPATSAMNSLSASAAVCTKSSPPESQSDGASVDVIDLT